MQNHSTLMSVKDIMDRFDISRMTVHRRIKAGTLKPVNASPALYRQHKLLFNREAVEEALGAPARKDDTAEQPAA